MGCTYAFIFVTAKTWWVCFVSGAIFRNFCNACILLKVCLYRQGRPAAVDCRQFNEDSGIVADL